MVLVNGIKYACERCIRGHRVTTCTHTDQPLMMIKPKGRPSTQCLHCKEQRKVKNSHNRCTCSKGKDPKTKEHEVGCACRVSGKCTCTSKPKTKSTKEKPDKDQEMENDGSSSSNSTPSTNNSNTPSHPNLESSKINPVAVYKTPSLSEQQEIRIKEEIQDELAGLANHQSSLAFNDYKNNNGIHSWDMNSPLISADSYSDGLTSVNSLMPSENNNNNYTNNNSNKRDTPDFQYFSKRQVGMDPLQNFRSSASTPQLSTANQKRLGEISVSVDEFVAPLNTMNNNLTNFLSSFNAEQPNGNINGDLYNNELRSPTEAPVQQTVESNKTVNSNFNNSNNDPYSNIPVPLPGNGLLDIFEDNSNIPYPNNRSTVSSPYENNGPDSLFPLFPLIGPSLTTTSSSAAVQPQSLNDMLTSNNTSNSTANLSYNNLNSHNSKSDISSPPQQQTPQQPHQLHYPYPYGGSHSSAISINGSTAMQQSSSSTSHHPQQLLRSLTGSSTHSSASLHSSSHHAHHSHHYHGSHGHSHQSHFSPYPQHQIQQSHQVPHRSASFLSISSSDTINSSIGSPGSYIGERPQLLSAKSTDSLNGFQLTNSKTNTTLMEDLHQTKTYTDPNGFVDNLSKGTPSLFQQHYSSLLDEESPVSNSSNTPGSNPSVNQLSRSQSQTYRLQQQQQQTTPFMDFSAIGSVPMSSFLPVGSSQQQSSTNSTSTNDTNNNPPLSYQQYSDNTATDGLPIRNDNVIGLSNLDSMIDNMNSVSFIESLLGNGDKTDPITTNDTSNDNNSNNNDSNSDKGTSYGPEDQQRQQNDTYVSGFEQDSELDDYLNQL